MTVPNVISIDNVDYVRADSVRTLPSSDSPIRIVVAQRGFVLVGRYSVHGEQVHLDQAHVIRQWGTKKGLGEIAIGGPTQSTVLDVAGHVELHQLAVVLTLAAEESKWASRLA